MTPLGKDGFAGVYSANDGMAGGAIAALKGGGIDPASRPITGGDSEIAAIQRTLKAEQRHRRDPKGRARAPETENGRSTDPGWPARPRTWVRR